MRQFRKFISILLMAAMLAGCLSVAAAEPAPALTLPKALKIIEEEAFDGWKGADKVVLPEGIERIESRAFADSSVKEVNLPSTLTFIADDAFDGTALETVTAEEGSYAYQWAVDKGYISTALSAKIKCNFETAAIGDTAVWTVEAKGGSGNYTYLFELFWNGKSLGNSGVVTDDYLENKFTRTGSCYVTCLVSDGTDSVKVTSETLEVLASRPLTAEISCNRSEKANVGDSARWTVTPAGGSGSYTYTFDIYVDGKRAGSSGATADSFLDFDFDKAASYYVTCKVSDGSQNVTVTSDTIVVTEAAPLSAELACDLTSAYTGDKAKWTVTAEGGSGSYTYAFTLSRDGKTVEEKAAGSESALEYTFTEAGSYTVKCVVSDGKAEKTVESQALAVTKRDPLTAELSCDLTEAAVGDTAKWTAKTTGGSEGVTYSFELFVDGKSVKKQEASDKNTFEYTFDKAGTVYVKCEVKDDRETKSLQSKNLTVVEALPLSAEIECDHEKADVGDVIKWTVKANGGSHAYSYSYEIFRDGQSARKIGSTSDNTVTYTILQPGTYHVECRVWDGNETCNATSEDIVVAENVGLSVQIECDIDKGVVGDEALWTASVTGGSGSYAYSFELFKDGKSLGKTGATNDNELKHKFTEAGTYTVKCQVNDGSSIATVQSNDLVIVGEDVLFEKITCDHTSANIGDEVVWTVNATGGTKSYTYSFEVFQDGKSVEKGGAGVSNTYSYTIPKEGTYYVTCTVWDGTDIVTEQSKSIVVKPAGSLTAVIACNMTSAKVNSEAKWTVTASGGSGKYTYSFELLRDGKSLGATGEVTDDYLEHLFKTAGSYVVKCTVSDGEDSITVQSKALVVTEGSAETLSATVTCSLTEAEIDDRALWTVEAAGGSGNYTYNFELFRNDKSLGSTGETDDNELMYVITKEGTYYVTCVVSDGTSSVTVQSADLECYGNGEFAAVISCDLDDAEPGNVAMWTVDAKGGTGEYTYNFKLFRDGKSIGTSGVTDDNELQATLTKLGEYYVTCEVSDGVDTLTLESDVLVVYDPDTVFARIECDSEDAGIGDDVIWSVEARGGSGEYTYQFELFRDSTSLGRTGTTDDNELLHTINKEGSYYVTCKVSDGTSTYTARSDTLLVGDADDDGSLSITGLDVDANSFKTTEMHTWEVGVSGGKKPYRYSYVLKRGTATLEEQPFSTEGTYSYTFFQSGSYTLTATVRDANRDEVTEDFDFKVTLNNTTLTASVRIYVDLKSSGSIDTSKPGHYELMINNEDDSEISFDNHIFLNPVFSYYTGTDSAGVVKVYDGSDVIRTGSKLYTFTFETTAADVNELLNGVMRDSFLDTASEEEDSLGFEYGVADEEFKKYVIQSTNCFTAVAAWCELLGYGKLSEIVSESSSYKDYYAYKMLQKYESHWNYEGEF